MDKVDYYKTLGIDKNATDREIKKSYRKLAMRYHPDRNPGNKQAENKFKEVKEAYEILIDPKKKSAYDQFGHSAFNQNNESHQDAEFASSFSHTTDFGDIFGDVFGDIFGQKNNSKSYDQRGSDLQYLMEITLEQAVKGAKKEITIPTLQSCNFCHGKGFPLGSKLETCTTCQGTGQLHTRQSFFTVQQTCPHCQGKGRKITNPCYVCKGTGRTKKSKKLSIKIPAGINNNDSIRLIEKGEAGKNGGPSGDLYIKIKIKKHPIFKRKENNLYCVVPIDFSTAALGGKICIPTLDKKIILKIPSETQSGKLFRIKGKGVKSIKNREIGDLLCQIIVETPINLNKKQKDLLIELQNSLSGLNKKKK